MIANLYRAEHLDEVAIGAHGNAVGGAVNNSGNGFVAESLSTLALGSLSSSAGAARACSPRSESRSD